MKATTRARNLVVHALRVSAPLLFATGPGALGSSITQVTARALNAADAAIRNADAITAMGMLPSLARRWHEMGAEGQRLLRDERSGDGSRTELYRRRKRTGRCAVSWNTPPQRVGPQTLGLAGLGDIEVRAPNGLPEASRLRAARVCVRKGRRGRCRVEVHLSVRIDVEGRTPDTETAVAGADMGCADTLTMHDGSTLALPDHDAGGA